MYPQIRSTSPDGRFQIHVVSWEARMSHWIDMPELRDTSTGEVMLSLADANWSMDTAQWHSPGEVSLSLRKYPGGHQPSSIEVRIDCIARSARIGEGAAIGLAGVEAALDRAIRFL